MADRRIVRELADAQSESADDVWHLVEYIQELSVGMPEMLVETVHGDDQPVGVAAVTFRDGRTVPV